MKKVFVLDTNVILHDHECIRHFAEHDVIIPITVLEELDSFKRGHDQLNYNAREFIRYLDSLSGDQLVKDGASLGKDKGRISIHTTHQIEDDVRDAFFIENKADNRILSVAYFLSKDLKDKQVILVSKDVNLRLKAKSLGLVSQDYYIDRIKSLETLYSGCRSISSLKKEIMSDFLDNGEVSPETIGCTDLNANEYLILKNRKLSALGVYDKEENIIRKIEKRECYGIKPRNAEQVFAMNALNNMDISLVTLLGKAGTGKTLLALASALEQRQDFQQIFLARPIIPLSNRDMGFLPGDIEKKLDPYMQPLFDNLGVIKNQFSTGDKEFKRITKMVETDKLLISPLSYIRGRSLDKIFFIIDEGQNLTPHEIKTIITRAGEGTKIVITGDPNQIDTPYLDSRSNGLSFLVDKMKGQQVFSHVTLLKGERSTLAELASDLL